MGNVGASIADVPVHLPHDANMLVAVEERVLVFAKSSGAVGPAVRRLVSLETGIGQDNNESLRVLVGGRNGGMLFRHELWQRRGRERLRPFADRGKVSHQVFSSTQLGMSY